MSRLFGVAGLVLVVCACGDGESAAGAAPMAADFPGATAQQTPVGPRSMSMPQGTGVAGAAAPKAAPKPVSICVKRGYQDNNDGTIAVCDEADGDGLLWQQTADDSTFTWSRAHDHCEQLNLKGGSWRMPTLSELMSIVAPTANPGGADFPSLLTAYFPRNTPKEPFWTATQPADDDNMAWTIDFKNGKPLPYSITERHYVRCVRQILLVPEEPRASAPPPMAHPATKTIACGTATCANPVGFLASVGGFPGAPTTLTEPCCVDAAISACGFVGPMGCQRGYPPDPACPPLQKGEPSCCSPAGLCGIDGAPRGMFGVCLEPMTIPGMSPRPSCTPAP